MLDRIPLHRNTVLCCLFYLQSFLLFYITEIHIYIIIIDSAYSSSRAILPVFVCSSISNFRIILCQPDLIFTIDLICIHIICQHRTIRINHRCVAFGCNSCAKRIADLRLLRSAEFRSCQSSQRRRYIFVIQDNRKL